MAGQVEARTLLVAVACQAPALRDRLRSALEALQFEVRTISTSREVLITMETHEVAAIVIVDDLPMGNALDLARAVRRHQLGGDIALLLLTPQPWSAGNTALALQELALVDVLAASIVSAEQVASVVHAELRGPSKSGVSTMEVMADQASHAERRHVEAAAQALEGETIELRGNLATNPFPELLHHLYRGQSTGALFLLRDNIKKIVYFSGGHPIYVKSNLLSECLGNVLVAEKMITPEECEHSLERMRETRRQQGTVLIELGSISPQNLVFGLELQLQTKLFDVFGWTAGEYLFKVDAKMPSEVVRLELSNAALIAEGVRRMWDLERLLIALAPHIDRFLAPAKDPELRFQHLPLDDMEQTFLEAIDGTYTLREQVARSPISDRRAYALAYVLWVTGVVEVHEQALRKRPAQVERASEDVRARQRLGQELLSLRSRDAFGVLGVAPTSSDAEVEQAYSRLAREYHPDRCRHYSAETRQMAREIFGLLYDAYQQIDSVDKRRSYREGQGPQDLEDISEVGRRSLLAEEEAARAQQLMEAERWPEAHAALEKAVAHCGDAGDLQAMLGWATYNLDPQNQSRLRESIRQLRRATELDPGYEGSYVYLGRIYMAIGRSILAEKQFERAVQCNPQCHEALEQLQLTKQQRKQRRTGTASVLLKIDTSGDR